ncbi:Ribosomal RNA-processing protein 14 [Talaromyces islandicus]|uniref:Ribosomal RNA-processing protein 14 n=1 Tax=Talaromyces islandicus TaxID=28573 RepID=A0A0U1LPT7_TALIS|nr:Ribosomal RNA-processing protein 14 [Talaromyces islandicus]
MADIEERLQSHSNAFSGLMSLIPSKYYYGEDVSDQWLKKKQTKEQAKNAKRAKLDPDAAKSAKDVLDENARKRKRVEDGEECHSGSSDSELGSELPREGLKRGDKKTKKSKQSQSTENNSDKPNESEEAKERRRLKAEKKAQEKAAQREKKKAKQAAKKAKKQEKDDNKQPQTTENPAEASDAESSEEKEEAQANTDVEDNDVDEDVDAVEGFALETKDRTSDDTSSTTDSPSFEMSNDNSGSSSISSIVPPSDAGSITAKAGSKPLKTTPEELRQRLQKRLAELRAARHADGLDGKPARTRQELIDARRRKAEERKQHKKELRRKSKEDEQLKKDDEMQRRFSPGGTGSLLASPRSPVESLSSNSNNFAFGRIAFPDGQHADPTLSRLLDDKNKQGARDPAAALKAAEAKKARLDSFDAEKRAEIEEKDMWLNAKKRAHGERVRDDTSLLKKALKRKETAKKKSEREWKERIDGVSKGKEMRQQRRDENIRKRKEERNSGGKKSGKGNPKARPGFEGSFKAKSAGGKKK